MVTTITKRELVCKITSELNSSLTQADVLEVIQKAVEIITDNLRAGNRVVLRNFGTFSVKDVKAKVGRNPKDPGKDVLIPPRKVVKFKVGKSLKEAASKVQ